MRRRLELYLLVGYLMMLFLSCGTVEATEKPKSYDWNNGYCSECGGELIWDSTGSKEHYICKICRKEYTFDRVMSKK